ncbi:type II toxin-antitoxin system RelE/ParE family toxin [Kitasatospora purpeofusca]|uniref:type II toxin-antitoxin system RelE/ParE family toxin n=1 Tax=Kitasatospora purpeofusca TaxID=67352 RepID=UPI002A5A3058|nr:type II toxin-antitoxin system RelE/ParE family toxin [Kitasatospora purpeofusca]MDY0815219.1 type II toxin-antitoxin system RelE/ParE family toxin [Kitasatospora purpeofusca]
MTGDGAAWKIEIEPEVRAWLRTCSTAEYRTAERAADRLAEDGELMRFPLASHLGGPLRELRIGSMRITYWLAPGRRAVLLTVFRKTRACLSDHAGRATPGHAPRRLLVGRRCSAWTPSSAPPMHAPQRRPPIRRDPKDTP